VTARPTAVAISRASRLSYLLRLPWKILAGIAVLLVVFLAAIILVATLLVRAVRR
jgi:hypothetical protein